MTWTVLYLCTKCKENFKRPEPIGLYCQYCSNPAEGLWRMLRRVDSSAKEAKS